MRKSGLTTARAGRKSERSFSDERLGLGRAIIAFIGEPQGAGVGGRGSVSGRTGDAVLSAAPRDRGERDHEHGDLCRRTGLNHSADAGRGE